MPRRPSFDAVVIGGGVAGLAAARVLSEAGRRVCLLEGRSRLGGRVATERQPGWPAPIELGAEFLHGEAAATSAALHAAGLAREAVPDRHLLRRGPRLVAIPDFWERFGALCARIPRRGRDRSFADFLRRARPPARDVLLARMLVEGYHAARLDRMSARSLAAAGGGDGEDAHRQARVPRGYDGVVEWLRAGLDPARTQVRLATLVQVVSWSRGAVALSCRTATGLALPPVRARAAVVTVPAGVLKAPAGAGATLRFDPEVYPWRRALAHVEVGHVRKLVLRFRERCWPADTAFLHLAGTPFPTWWSPAPRDLPVLTAWAGGPAAEALAGTAATALVRRALDSAARAFALPRRRLEERLEAWAWHDWSADPFSRGAYAYAGVGGVEAQRALARPIAETLWLAGEATSREETGTVSGAMDEGIRAARDLLRRG